MNKEIVRVRKESECTPSVKERALKRRQGEIDKFERSTSRQNENDKSKNGNIIVLLNR